MKNFALPIILGFASLATARTDISGCISSQTTNQWHEASMIWWVPDTGEICDFVDCGGGRAPPKTTVPGCPLYSGTETVTPSYMPGWGPNGKLAATTTTVAQTTSSTKTTATGESSENTTTATQVETGNSMITAAPTSSPVVSLTTTTSSASKVGNTSVSGNSTTSATNAVHTGAASGFAATNLAGVMAIVAAVVGAVAL
jgi:cytoskeletal protein RodZ